MWPRKLAKLMVIGGLTECVGPGGRERAGQAVSSELFGSNGKKSHSQRAEMSQQLAT